MAICTLGLLASFATRLDPAGLVRFS